MNLETGKADLILSLADVLAIPRKDGYSKNAKHYFDHLLFAPDGKCFDLAMDHGVFGNPAFLAGIENLPSAVAAANCVSPLLPQRLRAMSPLASRHDRSPTCTGGCFRG